ncbi:MAG: DHHA1 domain-containing protein, partial [Desulfuromonadales bacterium]|nr:DHHA1 domain-containing protein [Desulfuromonadales bacterium]
LVLTSNEGGKVSLLVAVTKDLTGRIKAGELIKPLAELVGGRGGGKPELAQAGGSQPENLASILEQAPQILQDKLAP